MPRVEAEVGSAANSYEILAKLASGGMAEIFLARGASATGVERYVVLKRILRSRAHDQSFVRMFLDEARLAAQLQHPNIAQVYDIGKLGDSYFFTMEYVHGETVRALLQRSHALRTPIPIASVLVVIAGAAAGLHHAHERIGLDGTPLGIVHRDVSPSNLIVSYEGSVKLVDFGVAKAAHRSQETRSGTVKGKISYLSPEQCRGAPIDKRSDLFSLGIVLWEMLTTERLYKRDSDFNAMAAIVSEEVPPPSTRRSEIPPELDALSLKLLAKTPEERFQSAAEAHEAIEGIAVRLGTALSSAALARYLRELFGQRPEPWVEMQSRETHPEVFTVTSEPIPVDLAAPREDALETQLGAVPDLTSDQGSAGVAQSPAAGLHRPFSAESDSSQNVRPAWRAPGTTGPQLPLARPHNTTGPPLPQGYPTYVRDPSGPHTAPPPSYSNNAYPLYVPPPQAPEDREPQAKRPRWIVIGIAAAIVIGIVIAIASTGGRVADDAHARTADAAVAVIAPVAAPVVVPVAKPATVPADAAAVAIVSDAAPALAPDAAAVAVAVAPVHVDKPSPADAFAKAMDAGDYSEAVALCVKTSSLVRSSCTLAACRAHDQAHARRWFVAAGSKPSLAATCKSAGTMVEIEKPAVKDKDKEAAKKDCEADPMACQH
ncbi:MAG: protein kinase [Deltaproteobacteria bacterium]